MAVLGATTWRGLTLSGDSGEMEGLLVGQDVGIDGLSNFFVDVGQVGTFNTDEPFLSSLSGGTLEVGAILSGFQAEGLVRLDNDGLGDFDNLHFDGRQVGTGTPEEPFIASLALDVTVLEVTNSAEADGGVGRNNLEGTHFTEQVLTRVQGERIGAFKADLLIGMTKLHLTIGVSDHLSFLISNHGILDNAVVSGRDHDHGGGSRDDGLVLLASEGLRTNDDVGDVGIVIQDMDIIVRLDSDHVGAAHLIISKNKQFTIKGASIRPKGEVMRR